MWYHMYQIISMVNSNAHLCRWWKISLRRSAVVYPGEWAIARQDVEDHERLLTEIERTFGVDVKDQVGCFLICQNNVFLH